MGDIFIIMCKLKSTPPLTNPSYSKHALSCDMSKVAQVSPQLIFAAGCFIIDFAKMAPLLQFLQLVLPVVCEIIIGVYSNHILCVAFFSLINHKSNNTK